MSSQVRGVLLKGSFPVTYYCTVQHQEMRALWQLQRNYAYFPVSVVQTHICLTSRYEDRRISKEESTAGTYALPA